ncbi:TPA: hypothetical protein MII92_14175 [Klebsiella pneumoniae]|jgi:predicted nuclease with TOPRIM domain|uniref:Uncharacterized protein n=3 Tax=Klebsiella pneumoniae complex TaxID=3390273 RepID=A0A6A8ZXT6_KLEPN|nr:hypothetical protein [Klebsiella pneumoniae]ASV27090.1 hypothetical protein CJU70_19755 [Klebsiella pneumoniae]ASV93525.1 hypothetical protein CI946_25870 [Klebsiella pneumoniae]ATM52311.1 hypothetical protein CRN73_03715 [Klebsiella pneumoniae]ATM58673.1 hypothetical protein CRN70_06720 [Klebsiella pneumoniae]AUH92441.1 hypothetical protein CYE02_20590 [Klebsiella pneumoniae]
MNIAEEASLIRQLEEARAIINQRNGEILHLKREAARYREQRDSANAMVKFLRGLFESRLRADYCSFIHFSNADGENGTRS